MKFLPCCVVVVLLALQVNWCSSSDLLGSRQVEFFKEPVNWHTAYENCRSIGMQLLTINNREELNRIGELSQRHTEIRNFFVAATDLGHEGKFVYATTGQVIPDLWAPGEPDNGNGFLEQDCVAITLNPLANFQDVSCDARLPYCCETVVKAAPTGNDRVALETQTYCTSVYRC